ncbi:DUF1642 domain-containing protein [Pisciglobus halotolerans]|uniref:Uncharacterized protein n=1 Tax=Pisciglobus halotolerans TaxID=745365 RepID=A0A1I3C2L7_9LACT|nr:DUF1642 domain-containing protein [Pisciglobus halotolerans]SFH68815.1 Protein of unknown function [Pisciglobus halotolerans]
MKKDKEWLKNEISRMSYVPAGLDESNSIISTNWVLNFVEQLEESEQEKVVIPQYTACFAPIGTRQGVYLYRESGSVKVGDNMKVYDKSKQEYHLTEQEIRNIDERFWAFAEEVTE